MSYTPKMHSDLSLSQKDIYEQHENLIKQGNFKDAVDLITHNNVDGVTASLLNSWEEAIKEMYISDISYSDPYVYKQTEPETSEMDNKVFWQLEY